MSNMFDFNELVKRAIKYIIEGLAVAICAYAIPKQTLKLEEVVIIALVAAATFSILDVFIPAMGTSARGGAGFGLGANLIGGLRMMPVG
jgi:ABC-type Co2+ transport system permease subunit